MTHRLRLRDERGIALIVVLLVALAVAAISAAAALISSNQSLISRYNDRQSALEAVADQGIEEARSRVNGNKTLYPDTGYNTLENGVAPLDASGAAVPNLTRWTYVGPTGITSGQYGVFGSVVTVVTDPFGNKVVRRGEIVQESFAKFAYFTDVEPATILFGGGDQLYGPVHSNDFIKIHSTGATFYGPVTTAKTVTGASYGTFFQGYQENVPRIELPTTAALTKLKTQAQAGGTSITGNLNGVYGSATTRIEFVAIDLNGDGDVTDANEGFIKVYQSATDWWVVAKVQPGDSLLNSPNCGHWDAGSFRTAAQHPIGPDTKLNSVTTAPRCFLGGSNQLQNPNAFTPIDSRGQWLAWGGAVSPLVAGRPDANYLFPITRQLNPNFKGVIYVEGKVAISGVLRGQVTLAATGDIVIADDVTYATDPGAGTCQDILGLFAGADVVVSNNAVNSPTRPTSTAAWTSYDDSKDEFVHAVILSLNLFTVDAYNQGAITTEACETKVWGRGCLYVTGGIIQSQRGAVGRASGGGGYGYIKRYSYDACAYSNPPPYFPTTGRFARARLFDVDPTGFSVDAYYRLLTPK